jgi:hypothetical protein
MSLGDYIISICTILMAVLGVMEKSQNIKWKPLSSMFGIDRLSDKIDRIENTQNEVKKIQSEIIKKTDKLQEKQMLDEKDRLQFEILSFASSIKNDYIPDEVEFKHIHEMYDKYTSLGGNSYIHEKMNYITKME